MHDVGMVLLLLEAVERVLVGVVEGGLVELLLLLKLVLEVGLRVAEIGGLAEVGVGGEGAEWGAGEGVEGG